MTERTFAAWVEPIARARHEARADVLDLARRIPADAWSAPSPNPGWTYKDLLAHIAASRRYLQRLVEEAVSGRPLGPSLLDTDAQNAADVLERREATVADLISETEAGADEVQEALSRLEETHKDLRFEEDGRTLGEFLGAVPRGHDERHLPQLRQAVEVTV